MDQIDKVLEDYGIPSESELGKAGSYIQNTPRHKVIELWNMAHIRGCY